LGDFYEFTLNSNTPSPETKLSEIKPPINEDASVKQVDQAWKEIGFHRPLGGLLYNIIIIFIAAGFGIFLTVYLIPNIILPFPESLGYTTLATNLFAVYFTLLDLGIGASIQRFVAEENIHNPRRALGYIQFFIWYQLFSGLMQVSVIALWVFFVVPRGEMIYAAWFFLIYSMIQYPGMLGIFRGTLEAYQRYDKASLIGFIQVQVFDNVLRIIFILIGRKLGMMNPMIGEMMGATMGAIFGSYLREIASALLAAAWVAPVLRQVDPSFGLKNLFYVEFDKEIIKKSLLFGFRVLIPGLINPLANLIVILLYVNYLPSYASYIGIFATGEMLSHMVTTFAFNGVGASVSESFNNGKYKLAKYYIEQVYRWLGAFSWFMIGLLLFGASLIGGLVGGNWQGVSTVIQILIFFKLFNLLANHVDNFLVGANRPELNIILAICENVTRIVVLWIFLVPYPSGLLALIYSLGMSYLAKWLVGHLIFHFKVLKIQINVWCTFIAPMLAAGVEATIIWFGVQYVMPLFIVALGRVFGPILLMVIFIAIGPIFLYFPFYALFGGWDDEALKTFSQAVEMAGPSKFYVKLIYRYSVVLAKYSPLTNRFKISTEGVNQEIHELMEIRQRNAMKTKK
jgi:O-antigen/teichoic acid export membrane protein